jgi:hypothetical protein
MVGGGVDGWAAEAAFVVGRQPSGGQQTFGVTEIGKGSQNRQGSEYHPDIWACTVPSSRLIHRAVWNCSTSSASTFSFSFFIESPRSRV